MKAIASSSLLVSVACAAAKNESRVMVVAVNIRLFIVGPFLVARFRASQSEVGSYQSEEALPILMQPSSKRLS